MKKPATVSGPTQNSASALSVQTGEAVSRAWYRKAQTITPIRPPHRACEPAAS